MKYRYFLSLLIVAVFNVSASSDLDWKLRKDQDNIQIYTRKVEGSPYAAVKAVTQVSGLRLSSLAALIMDAEACAKWADKCAESYVYEQISDTEAYIYSHNDMPFPVKDRDALAHVKWSQDSTTKAVLMQSVATKGILPEKKGRLRLTEASTHWRFTPLADGRIEVVNEAHINPGSAVPSWFTNMLLVDTPFQTLVSFINEARNPKYKDVEMSFITEP